MLEEILKDRVQQLADTRHLEIITRAFGLPLPYEENVADRGILARLLDRYYLKVVEYTKRKLLARRLERAVNEGMITSAFSVIFGLDCSHMMRRMLREDCHSLKAELHERWGITHEKLRSVNRRASEFACEWMAGRRGQNVEVSKPAHFH